MADGKRQSTTIKDIVKRTSREINGDNGFVWETVVADTGYSSGKIIVF